MANLVHLIHRFYPAQGGAESVALRVCSHLSQAGHSVQVETTNGLAPDSFHATGSALLPSGQFSIQGVQVHRHRCIRIPFQRLLLGGAQKLAPNPLRPWLNWYSPIAPSLFKIESDPRLKPDLVVAWALPHGSIWASAVNLAKNRRVPLVAVPFLHPGNPTKPNCSIRKAFRSPWLVKLLSQAEQVIALTEWERTELLVLGIHEHRIAVCGLGVEPSTVSGGSRPRFRKAHGLDEGQIVVGHLATFSSEKGTFDLLRARGMLPASEGPTIVLAGNSPKGFERQLTPFKNEPWLKVTGALNDQEKRDFFAGIDMLCLPSLVDSWSLTLLEAWSVGVGAIVYDAGGPGNLIRQGIDGIKVPVGNIIELAKALQETNEKPNLASMLGSNGMARIPLEFDWQSKLDSFERIVLKNLKSA